MKTCSKCQRELPLESFSKCKASKDGFHCHCKDCIRAYNKARKERDQEAWKAKQREYQAKYRNNPENKGRIKERNQRWYEENKEAVIERQVAYNRRNKEHINQRRRQYRQDNLEAMREKERAHARSEQGKAVRRRYLQRLKFSNAKISTRTLTAWATQIKERDGWICQECGSTENLHAHHIKPKVEFPELALDLDNGIALCEQCHDGIHGR